MDSSSTPSSRRKGASAQAAASPLNAASSPFPDVTANTEDEIDFDASASFGGGYASAGRELFQDYAARCPEEAPRRIHLLLLL